MRVDAHGHRRIRMPQQRLRRLHIFTIGGQHSRKRLAKHVPTEVLGDASKPDRRCDVVVLQRLGRSG